MKLFDAKMVVHLSWLLISVVATLVVCPPLKPLMQDLGLNVVLTLGHFQLRNLIYAKLYLCAFLV
jgi:hypothetical protein